VHLERKCIPDQHTFDGVLDPFVLDHRRFECVTRIGDLVDQPFL
jgi:hypothetical protein